MQSDTPHEPDSAGDDRVSGLNPPNPSPSGAVSGNERALTAEERLEAGEELTDEEWEELERATNPEEESSPAPVVLESPSVATVVDGVEHEAASDVDPPSPTEEVLDTTRSEDSLGDSTAGEVPTSEAESTPTEARDRGDESGRDADPEPVADVQPDVVLEQEIAAPTTTDDADDLDASATAAPTGGDTAASGTVDAIDAMDAADTPAEEEETVERVTLNMPLPRVIAVANQKGGVGKTTTTVNVAACLAEQGYRTLLVDLDPQANASTGLGLEPRELAHSVYHVMLHDADADSCIEPTEVKNLFVLPSSLDLAGAEIELVAMMSREHRLRLAIDSVIDDYDYVLIDCPPSLGLLTINALTAANEVLVPIQCEYYALEGLGQLMRNVELVKANLNPKLQISHLVLVMFDPRTKLAGQVVDEVRGHFGDLVCENVIPRTVRLSEAPSFGQPITTFDSESRGASAYRAVTQEVIGGQA